MTSPYILVPRDALSKISGADIKQGGLQLRHVESDDFYVITKIEVDKDVRFPVDIPKAYRRLHWGDIEYAGHWVRAPGREVNLHHWFMVRRAGTTIPFDLFKDLVPEVRDPGMNVGLLITHDPEISRENADAGIQEFAAWLVAREGVQAIFVAVEPEIVGLRQLAECWPIDLIGTHSALIIGCGSIGSAAAEALASYGIGRLELVDPDRLLWHNLIRHTLGPEHVGRPKVDGLRSQLHEDWPNTVVNAHPLDVVDHAHFIRPLASAVDIVLCAADGIAPRRVVNHIARRARKPVVMACVLDHGRVGEVIRLRPSPRFGCLLCLRDHLGRHGAMDAEADQELAYGTGQIHQPMTATPADLGLVGTLAAKITVATLLEARHGDHSQRLPGEHAIVGLHPTGDLSPPFDLQRAGEIRWHGIPPPRPACPTCGST